jgi:two-component system, OmpR family, phosphate regulon sensor histidine kinase PhoR
VQREDLIRGLRLRILIWTRWLQRTRGIWLRAAVCLAVGIVLALVDSSAKFDLRFQIRGPQVHDSRFVIVYLDQDIWTDLTGRDQKNMLRPLKEISAFTDSFFWSPSAWNRLLSVLLNSNPAGIAVTLFFPSGSLGTTPERSDYQALYDPKVIWAARLDSDGRAVMPAFSSNYGLNSGLLDFFTDEDRSVRRFTSPLVQVPHLAMRLANAYNRGAGSGGSWPGLFTGESRIINFQGGDGTYLAVNARDLLRRPARAAELVRGRMVIIGTKDLDGHIYSTPVGSLSRAELTANVTDNILNHRWILRPPFWVIAAYLVAILFLAVTILQSYPQVVALVFLFWVGLGSTAASLWLFDAHYIWLPVMTPLVQIFITYMVFVGYQLTLQENLNWRLEKEKEYLQEIEQLKNNFVSLFSHDLKTPIAKIQAICDRLMVTTPSPEVQSGLQSLRQESTELHRYIQSILRVSRVESSEFRINKEPSDINELIFKVCQQLRPLADAKRIRIETNLEPIFAMEVDPTLIQEVILNLVENAIKYSPEASAVMISSREVGDQVIVTVTDAGPGIPADEQSRIFEKFYRGTGHSLSTKGSGLGLYLVKYFVELHGGRVFVKSGSQKGTRFGFVLPLETEELNLSERNLGNLGNLGNPGSLGNLANLE